MRRYREYLIPGEPFEIGLQEAQTVIVQGEISEGGFGVVWRANDPKTATYCPGPYRIFTIYEKKPRLISAAPFRDRVVHQGLRTLSDIKCFFLGSMGHFVQADTTHLREKLCEESWF